MQIIHAKSLTVLDGTNTDIVRPSDWNSRHAMALTLTGNTAGNSTVSGTNILWEGGPGVTLSGTGSTIIISAGAGVGGGGAAISAGTQSQSTGTVAFSNSNGLTFGLSNGTLTASHNGITTAAQSNHSHGDPQLNLTNLSGTTASNSAGLTISLSAAAPVAQSVQTQNLVSVQGSTGAIVFSNSNGITFGGNASTITASHNGLTTAAQSNHSHGNPTLALTNLGGTTASNSAGLTLSLSAAAQSVQTQNQVSVQGSTGAISFANGNGITFGGNASTLTASHNGLTTARASNDGVGLATALTAGPLAWTVNSAGLSLNAGGAAGTSSGFAGNLISGSITHNTAGINVSLNHPAWLTTAAQSGHSHGNPTLALTNLSGTTASNSAGLTLSLSAAAPGGGGGVALSAGTQSVSTGTVAFANSNGVSFGMSGSNQITASHNGLTTARASNDGVGLNTAQTNVTWTVNSSGISLNAGGYAGTGTSATNASITLNSNGLAISVAAPGGGGAINVSAGTTSGNLQTIVFSNSNNITFGLNGSTVTASAAGGGGGIALGNSEATYTSGTVSLSGINLTVQSGTGNRFNLSAPATSSLVGAGGITISTAGSTISISGPTGGGAVTVRGAELFVLGNNTVFSTLGQNSIYFQKFINQSNVSFNNYEMRYSGSTVSSSVSQVAAHTYDYGLYSRQTGTASTAYSLAGSSRIVFSASFSSNLSAGYTISQGGASFTSTSAGTGVLSALTGFKHAYFPFTSTITQGGEYAVALRMSSATTVGTSPLRIGIKHQTYLNNLTIGRIGTGGVTATNASNVDDFAMGVYSATSSNLPNTLAISGLTNAVSQARLHLQFEG